MQGPRLYLQQWYGLFLKRMLSAKRDRLALVTQLLVPIALVLVALWARQATDAFPQEPVLDISRRAAPFACLLTCDPFLPLSLTSASKKHTWSRCRSAQAGSPVDDVETR